ncbi:MAG: M15 family metallopeptidase [Actinomycetota bacterium]|nr:M15 family metallopeptidase [Actinomycetota bacterium]
MRKRLAIRLLVILALVAGCSEPSGSAAPDPVTGRGGARPAAEPSAAPTEPAVAEAHPLPRKVSERPPWLGDRVLARGPNGFGVARFTPKLLRDRRLVTVDHLPPPRSDRFSSSVSPIPRDVLARSTWQRGCPVRVHDLAYVTIAFWGFDSEPHTGELIVHTSVARPVVSVFRKLYRARWPIEEMRVTTREELRAPPTGDGNNTSGFVCRPARLATEWSEHAYGLAVDVNPFHNPYVRNDLVLPELALAYRNRGWQRPGMIRSGDVVTRAFAAIGWSWGGSWSSAKDWMHFSRSGD